MKLDSANFRGEAGNGPWKGQPSKSGATAATSFVYPQFIIDLAAATGVDDITPVVASIDGLLWICDAHAGEAQVAVTLERVGDAVVYASAGYVSTALEDREDVIQVGRDWILTTHMFLYRDKNTGQPGYLLARSFAGLPDYATGGTLAPDYGVLINFEYRNENDWLFTSVDRGANVAPYWERMNPVFCGYNVLHDWLMPRPDHGRSASQIGYGSTDEWCAYGVNYSVHEPMQGGNHWYYFDFGGEYTRLTEAAFMGLPWERINYAVFVVDNEIYVRSSRYAGRGRFIDLHKYVTTGAERRAAAALVNMHDFNIWSKNYPDFAWEDSCIGKIGNTVILFETAESEYAPEALGPMRIAATGRYIPMTIEVPWGEDPDGTNSALIPPIKYLTAAEEHELMLSISCVVNPDSNRAYGYNDDILKTYVLDEEGVEAPASDDCPSYKSVANHFTPGGNPIIGNIGPYVVSADKNYAYITDTTNTLMRMAAPGKIRPFALETRETQVVESEPPATIIEEYGGVYNAKPGKIEYTPGMKSTAQIAPKDNDVEVEFKKYSLDPVTSRIITISTGTDAYTNGLLGKHFPVVARTDAPENGVFNFAWVHPETGALTATSVSSSGHSGDYLAVEYDTETGVVRFGYISGADQSFNPIQTPSYLDGWVGATDRSSTTGSATWSDLVPNDQRRWGVNMVATCGLRDGPALEFCETILHTSHFAKYDALRVDRHGDNKLSAQGAYWIGYPFFDFLHSDFSGLPLRITLAPPTFNLGATTDTTARVSGSAITSEPRSHFMLDSAWGIPQNGGPKRLRLGVVCMAHYVYVPSRFKVPNARWIQADAQYYDVYRYQRQLNAIKCRKGYNDHGVFGLGPSYDLKWTDHRFAVFEFVIDREKYLKLTEALFVRNEWTGPPNA